MAPELFLVLLCPFAWSSLLEEVVDPIIVCGI
jgi:hypothetical protein